MRSLSNVKQLGSRLAGKQLVNLDEPYVKYAHKAYDFYAYELKTFDTKKEFSEAEKFIKLYDHMNSIKNRFGKIFKKTVDNTPGMRLYLLNHSRFDSYDFQSRDWLVQFMISYLEPTPDELDELTAKKDDMRVALEKANVNSKVIDKLEGINCVIVDEDDDDTIITYGMWDKVDGMLQSPISLKSASDAAFDYVPEWLRRVRKTMDDAGLLDIETRSVIVEENV